MSKRASERAMQRAVKADGRVIPVRGHVKAEDAPTVTAMMANAAPVLQQIRDGLQRKGKDNG